MAVTKDYISVQHLLDRIDAEYASVTESISKLQHEAAAGPSELQRLTDQQTQAFVDLAQHYLPELSHRALSNTWIEIRGQIRELYLLKEDRCRGLRENLAEIADRLAQLRPQRNQLRQQFEKARLDHGSKQGNVHKVLRDDPAVVGCLADIEKVDQQIDLALKQLDLAEAEAETKLPAYEESVLFQYLHDRKFGTPEYNEKGLERRWDRWLAKLIDYSNVKKSYKFLHDTPANLQELIHSKRDRYKRLLEKLDLARVAAFKKFGLPEQKGLLDQLGVQLHDVDRQVEQWESKQAEIGSELCELESSHGTYYQRAIEIYRDFLTTLDPEVLKVYAECTDSPVDDQICARTRMISQNIDVQTERDGVFGEQLARLDEYQASIWQLKQKLRYFVHSASLVDDMIEEIPIDAWLKQLRTRTHSPDEIWDTIVQSLIYRAELVLEESAIEVDPESDIIEATFVAATNHPLETADDRLDFDPNRIVLAADKTDFESADLSGGQLDNGFRVFAFCDNRPDATCLISMLDEHSIPCFFHDPVEHGTLTLNCSNSPNQIAIMVKSRRLGDANKLITDLQAAASRRL